MAKIKASGIQDGCPMNGLTNLIKYLQVSVNYPLFVISLFNVLSTYLPHLRQLFSWHLQYGLHLIGQVLRIARPA